MTKQMPQWKIPKNLPQIIAEDEMWEDESWHPILLRVTGGTTYQWREILLAWEIELPLGEDDFFDSINAKLEDAGFEVDGYLWLEIIESQLSQENPSLAEKMNTGDTENAGCVIWVESEGDCKELIEFVWKLVRDEEKILSTQLIDEGEE